MGTGGKRAKGKRAESKRAKEKESGLNLIKIICSL
jgi:hypothetical protein